MFARVSRRLVTTALRAPRTTANHIHGSYAPVTSITLTHNAVSYCPPYNTRGFASKKVPVPNLGDSITEGTIVQWNKNVGDAVQADDVIVVIETDKVSVDIRAPSAGVLTKQLVKAGDTVAVGQDIADIDTDAKASGGGAAKPTEKSTEKAPAKSADAKSADTKAAPSPPQSSSSESKSTKPAQPSQDAVAHSEEPHKSAPKAVQGTVGGPSVNAPDSGSKPAAAKSGAAPSSGQSVKPPPSGTRGERRVPMSRMRATIANRLKTAQNTAASLTTFNEIDMSVLMALRSKYKDDFFDKFNIKLGFMSAFVKAAASALQAMPEVNASIDGTDIVYHDFVDISVAVSTPTGLVVPVLRNVEAMNFAQIESAINALGQKARKGQIAIEDMVGGTFTISNGGVYGSLFGTPILNPPQSAILGMHGIFERPIAVNGKMEIRPMMYVALTYDHRMIDGGQAVTFLKAIKSAVEDPSRLLLSL